MDDQALIEFMSECGHKYKAGTLLVIYSFINKMHIMDKGVNLNTWPRLRAVMKDMIEKFVAKKANTFTPPAGQRNHLQVVRKFRSQVEDGSGAHHA